MAPTLTEPHPRKAAFGLVFPPFQALLPQQTKHEIPQNGPANQVIKSKDCFASSQNRYFQFPKWKNK